MLGALLYLRLTSLKNILLSRLRRLKQPKYLVGAVVGAAYFYLVFFRRLTGAARPRSVPMPRGLSIPALPEFDLLPVLATGGALLLLIIITLAWALPSQKPGLVFSEAEVTFLFPAPISRRRLIHFKLLGAQFRILVSALFFTLISSGWNFLGGGALIHALGWWIILTAVNLHLMGATLTVTRLIDGGVSTTRRRVAVLGVISAATVATIVSAIRGTPFFVPGEPIPTGPFAEITLAAAYVARFFDAGAFHWLLLPGKWVLGPFLATDWAMFLRAFWPAALLIVVHYWWVARLEVSFEEASVAISEKRAARLARLRSGGPFNIEQPRSRREPFRLHDTGRPEFAFLWKNLLSSRPYFNWQVWVGCAATIAVGVPWILRYDEHGAFAITITLFAAIFAVYTLLLGPQLARQDLRSDLANADILKTYPLAGWQILLGQLLTPAAILTGLLWLALLAGGIALASRGESFAWATPAFRLATGLCIALVIPPLCTLQLLVPNAAALVFPGWFQATRQRGGGIDVMGQRLIFVFVQVLVVVLALLPLPMLGSLAALCTYGFFYLIHLIAPGVPGFAPIPIVVITAITVFALLVGEVWCGLWWLGRRFEKFDVVTELRS